MLRRIFAVLSAVSLLAAIAVGYWALGGPSFWQLAYAGRGRLFALEPDYKARVKLTVIQNWPGNAPLRWRRLEGNCATMGIASIKIASSRSWGFGVETTTDTIALTIDEMGLPLLEEGTRTDFSRQRFSYEQAWSLRIDLLTAFLAFVVLPGLWLAATLFKWHRNKKRRLRGLCVKCAYDLRASTECCPECGTLIPAQPRERDRANLTC